MRSNPNTKIVSLRTQVQEMSYGRDSDSIVLETYITEESCRVMNNGKATECQLMFVWDEVQCLCVTDGELEVFVR